VTLPLSLEEKKPAAARPEVTEQSRKRGLRVLLVEDHSQSRKATARLLGTLGYRVQTAEGFTDAVTRLNAEPFDLLISDIDLPDGSGWNLMKAAQSKRPIKGLALSGYSSEEDQRKSMETGFAAHLVKPITLQRLTEAIERAVTPLA
jgi:CheY-like chemotaxis protein